MNSTLYTVNQPVMDMWRSASRDSERVSQRVIGMHVRVMDMLSDHWWQVEGDDGYEGYVESRLLSNIAERPNVMVRTAFASMRSEPTRSAPLVLRLSIGSLALDCETHEQWTKLRFAGGLTGWVMTTQLIPANTKNLGDYQKAPQVALTLLGTPYLWGGTSAYGIDCSGLTQLMYRVAGVMIRRDAHIQRSDDRFEPVSFEHLQAGDLVFFGTEKKVTHVGMDVGNGSFIHASGGTGVNVTPWSDTAYRTTYVDARRLRQGADRWNIPR